MEKGKGQRRWLAQRKCPPVREPQEEPARKGEKGQEVAGPRKCPPVRESREGGVEKGEKMGQRRGWAKENACR
ncbi:MAG: hypothetical protein ACLTXL_07115 [Clostridia bacterium]